MFGVLEQGCTSASRVTVVRMAARHQTERHHDAIDIQPQGLLAWLNGEAIDCPPRIVTPTRAPMAVTESALLDALKAVTDPNTGRDFVSGRQVKNLHIEGTSVSFDVELGYLADQLPALRQALIAAARGVAGRGERERQHQHQRSPPTRCSAACSCCRA